MKTFAVIGLGSFGYYLTRALVNLGHDVLAIDTDEDAVNRVSSIASKAIIADCTDPQAVAALGLTEYDSVNVSLGGNIDASVLTTLNLKEAGVQHIVAKALTETHGKALEKVGANEVVLPRRDMAARLAHRLVHADILEFVPLGSDYGIMEAAPRADQIGKSLTELDFRKQYNVSVIVVRQLVPDEILVAPDGDFVVKDSDILVLLGRNEDLEVLQTV